MGLAAAQKESVSPKRDEEVEVVTTVVLPANKDYEQVNYCLQRCYNIILLFVLLHAVE